MIKRAISNIAWTDKVSQKELYELLHKYDISGIECAPTKILEDLNTVSLEKLLQIKNSFNSEGFEIPAFQALCYNHPELQVFDQNTHQMFFKHFRKLAHIAEVLNAKTLVFGSPKNRLRKNLANNGELNIAGEFFTTVGNIFNDYGCVLGLEANPKEYNSNFLFSSSEVENFVKNYIHSSGVKFHYDTGADLLNHIEPMKTLENLDTEIAHVHFSPPYLSGFDPNINPNIDLSQIDFHKILEYLESINYPGWVSVEIKSSPEGIDELEYIEKSLKIVFG